MLDQNFCDVLEYRICNSLKHTNSAEVKELWCDGVLIPELESYYPNDDINNNRQVIGKAFIGVNGQTPYELTLKFGSKSFDQYLRGLDIKECIPAAEDEGWFQIDVKNRKVEVQLD